MLRPFALIAVTAVALMCSPVVADKDDDHATQLQLADEYQKALEEITHLRQVHANSQADKDATIEKLRQQVEHLRGDSLSRHKKEPPAANTLQRVNTGNKPKPLSLGEVAKDAWDANVIDDIAAELNGAGINNAAGGPTTLLQTGAGFDPDPTITLVTNKMGTVSTGCGLHLVAVNGLRSPEKDWASDLCFDTRLRFPLADGTNSADFVWVGGDSVCTVSVCHTHVPANTDGTSSALGIYPSDSYWNGNLLTKWSVYYGNIKCGEMKKYTLCQLNTDPRGRATRTTVTGSDGNPLPSQCKSSKECSGLTSFDLRYMNVGLNWAAMGASTSHGHTGPGHWDSLIPTSLYNHVKGLKDVQEGANLVCQAKCAKL